MKYRVRSCVRSSAPRSFRRRCPVGVAVDGTNASRCRRGSTQNSLARRSPRAVLALVGISNIATARGYAKTTPRSEMRVSTSATGETSSSARMPSSARAQRRGALGDRVARACRDRSRSARGRRRPNLARLEHQRDEVRARAGDELLPEVPPARRAHVLVAHHADHLAAHEHGRVEHRGDATGLQVQLVGELARAHAHRCRRRGRRSTAPRRARGSSAAPDPRRCARPRSRCRAECCVHVLRSNRLLDALDARRLLSLTHPGATRWRARRVARVRRPP